MGDDAALAACKDAFAAQNIPWTILEHEPVLTVEAGLEATKALRFLVKPTEGQPEPVLALPADYSRDGELHLPWSWFASVYKSME